MSQTQNAVELLALLVEETYGELASRIFIILLRCGRLPIPAISRYTSLTQRQLRPGVAVLIQQNLIYHDTDSNGLTHYEANPEAAYALVRSGKILELVSSRFGILEKDLVHNLLLLGHTRYPELVEFYRSKQKQTSNGATNRDGHSTTNGINEESSTHTNGSNGYVKRTVSIGQIDAAMMRLLESGLVEPVVETMFRSPSDLYNQLEKRVLNEKFPGGLKGTKQKEVLKQEINDKLEETRSEGRNWKSYLKSKTLTNGANGIKRRKLSHGGGAVNGNHICEDDGTKIDPNLTIRVNQEKFAVVLRNMQLAEVARNRIGFTTSQVYSEFLKQLERHIDRIEVYVDNDVGDEPSVSAQEVASSLSKSVNPALGIGKITSHKDEVGGKGKEGIGENTKKRGIDEIKPKIEPDAQSDEDEVMEDNDEINGNGHTLPNDNDEDSDDPFADAPPVKPPKRPKVTFQEKLPLASHEDRENRLLQVKGHLALLEGDSYKFLRKTGVRGLGEWSVDFKRIFEYVRESELDQVIFDNYGTYGHRLIRVLKKMGKLDEKSIPNLVLMKQKDTRTTLAEMQMAGVVDIQEVPKDAARSQNNHRVIFLWFFDSKRYSATILENIYKQMSRLIQRLGVERRAAREIKEITERSDIRDQPVEDYLDPQQINKLYAFQGKEDMLLGQIGRLDELMGIFRDY